MTKNSFESFWTKWDKFCMEPFAPDSHRIGQDYHVSMTIGSWKQFKQEFFCLCEKQAKKAEKEESKAMAKRFGVTVSSKESREAMVRHLILRGQIIAFRLVQGNNQINQVSEVSKKKGDSAQSNENERKRKVCIGKNNRAKNNSVKSCKHNAGFQKGAERSNKIRNPVRSASHYAGFGLVKKQRATSDTNDLLGDTKHCQRKRIKSVVRLAKRKSPLTKSGYAKGERRNGLLKEPSLTNKHTRSPTKKHVPGTPWTPEELQENPWRCLTSDMTMNKPIKKRILKTFGKKLEEQGMGKWIFKKQKGEKKT